MKCSNPIAIVGKEAGYKMCRRLTFKMRRSGALAMSNDYYWMLQTSIICLLLFLVGMTAMVQHPTWFQ